MNVIKSKKSEGKEEECIRMSVCSSFELPDLAGGENGNFTSASAYLSVFYNREKGRHVVATHDIKVGDVLFVEKPFAFIIFQDVCHSCCKKTVAPIP